MVMHDSGAYRTPFDRLFEAQAALRSEKSGGSEKGGIGKASPRALDLVSHSLPSLPLFCRTVLNG